eukprot:CAMPEP_0172174344 /NCGR_PEP_ID=MMETSP1050-20130122/13605_1 /TAXON_ID=233186 /ORGANISM="Cryptomonas curvata, Strain CCAP979/52" /LENGTH=321 /DNA_ID=CAMNT_0012846295 /DNA_START=72 /DNA_END=1034 /DNA_ORIENTATION=+
MIPQQAQMGQVIPNPFEAVMRETRFFPPASSAPLIGEQWAIVGAETQVLVVLLQPNQEIMCEPGSLFHSDDGIEADADMGGCCNAIKRSCCAGEDLFRVHYVNKSNTPRTITLNSPYPTGKLIGVDLQKFPGMTMKKGAWSASMGKDTEFGYRLAKNLTTGCCAGQGLILTTIKGSGTAFLNAGGTVFQRDLGVGEKITIDTQALVACAGTVDIGVRRAGSIMMMCCGGEGLFVCELTGPGLVILQSMPVEKAAMTYYKYMPKQGAAGAAAAATAAVAAATAEEAADSMTVEGGRGWLADSDSHWQARGPGNLEGPDSPAR